MTGFVELRDQANRATDLQEKELLLEQLEAMHRAADEESKLHEDLIRGDWGFGISTVKHPDDDKTVDWVDEYALE